MSRKTDLERHIRGSYRIIHEYEEIIKTSSDPKERERAERGTEEQWRYIKGYLVEYRRLVDDALPPDISEIAAHFGEESEQAQLPTAPAPEKPSEGESESLSARAQELLDQDSLDEAIGLLRKSHTDYPDDRSIERLYLEAMYRKGVRLYVGHHNLPQARRAFQQVVDKDPYYENAAQLLDEVEQRLKRMWPVRMGRVLRNPGFIVSVLALVIAFGTWFWPDIRDLLFPSATSTPSASFNYQVRVQAEDTGEYVQGARIAVDVAGQAPLDAITDMIGFARVFIPSSYAEQPAVLIVEAVGYERYTKNIVLIAGTLPDVAELEEKQIATAPVEVDARDGPGTPFDVVGIIQQGRVVGPVAKYTNREGELWYKIGLPDGLKGWVQAGLVTPDVSPESISIECRFGAFEELIRAEGTAVVNEDIGTIFLVFARDAVIVNVADVDATGQSKTWTDAIQRYQEKFEYERHFRVDHGHFALHTESTSQAFATTSSSGEWMWEQDLSAVPSPTPLFYETPPNADEWTFGKDVNGCWVITRFEFNAHER